MKQTGKMLGAGLLAGLFALLAEPANAETWCIRDAGSPPPGACVFPSAQDCSRAAVLNPFGGICERQPLGLNDRAEDRKKSGRRSTRRKGTSQ
jgi:hypothetical protein